LAGYRRDQDAYGHEIWDYFTKTRAWIAETVERSDGLVDPSETNPASYFASYKEWPGIEKRGIKYAKGSVLDVGCGPGRVAVYLQDQRKLEVVGIDNSPLALKVARQRGLKRSKRISFKNVSAELGRFDTIIMYRNNFGLFGSFARARTLLKKLYRMTTDDALVICESLNPYDTKDPDHLSYQRQNKARGRMGGQVRIRVRYRKYIGRWFDYLLVSPEEMKEIVKGTGWRFERLIQSKGSPLYVAILSKTSQKV